MLDGKKVMAIEDNSILRNSFENVEEVISFEVFDYIGNNNFNWHFELKKLVLPKAMNDFYNLFDH